MKITKVTIAQIPNRSRNKIIDVIDDFINSDNEAIKIEDDNKEYKSISGLGGVFRNAIKRLGLNATITIQQHEDAIYLVKKAAQTNANEMLDV